MNDTLKKTIDVGHLMSINLLKSIAILMVLFVHTGQLFKGSVLYGLSFLGELGCQCFFMISGFTLCMSWDKRNVGITQFYARRYKVIAPGYYSAILLFFILTIFVESFGVPHYWAQNHSLGGVFSNMLMIHGFFPDYLNSVVPGGWYIGTTMLMYCTFPFLKRGLEWMNSKNKVFASFLPWATGLLVVGIWMLVDKYFGGVGLGNNTFLYFSILTQYPCFILGAAIYIQCKSGSCDARPIIDYCLCACLAVVTVWLFYSKWEYAFSIVPLLAASCFAFLLLGLVKTIDVSSEKGDGWGFSFINRVSHVSYEMYLVHTFFAYYVVWYMRKVIRHLVNIDIFSNTFALLISYCFVVVLSYYSGKVLHAFLRVLTRIIFRTEK